MSVLADASLAPSVDTAAELKRFLAPDCAALIWRRKTPPDTLAWLQALDPEALPRGRVIVPGNAVRDVVTQFCDMSGLALGAHRDWLIDDITALADAFGTLMGVRYLRLRLDVVTTNACRRFHIDAITARLVCTYRGTGTQYGQAQDGDVPGIDTVPTGAPILLRGSNWAPEPDRGLLHRSPPIEGTGETRLVLVLDPVFDPAEEADPVAVERVHMH
ncbi:MAG: DUF1826 domain-containing protein [Pseudomonadota bacterium]